MCAPPPTPPPARMRILRFTPESRRVRPRRAATAASIVTGKVQHSMFKRCSYWKFMSTTSHVKISTSPLAEKPHALAITQPETREFFESRYRARLKMIRQAVYLATRDKRQTLSQTWKRNETVRSFRKRKILVFDIFARITMTDYYYYSCIFMKIIMWTNSARCLLSFRREDIARPI